MSGPFQRSREDVESSFDMNMLSVTDDTEEMIENRLGVLSISDDFFESRLGRLESTFDEQQKSVSDHFER